MVRNHQSVDWTEYFSRIKSVCPWSYSAWSKNKIEITRWQGQALPLGDLEARVYIVDTTRRRLKKLAKQLDHGDCEWLWSEPNYGVYGTPLPVLIQQSRQRLNDIRKHH